MQSTYSLPMNQTYAHPQAAQVTQLTHKEAGQLAAAELAAFISLVESLEGVEWQRPTMCTQWSVRDILAHQAGAYASGARFAELRRQVMGNPYMKEEKMPIDAINRRQLEDREGRSPEALLAELRTAGPKAIASRQRLPGLLRAMPLIDFGPPVGRAPFGYLTDSLYVRDTWSHRLDICVATEREMVLSPAHDGRITALVVRDLEKTVRPQTRNGGFVLELMGPAGGIWQIGEEGPTATIAMDTLDFHILASGRLGAGEMLARGKATLSGDSDYGKTVMGHFSVLY